VRLGLVKSPALCECSAANLRENLEQSLGLSVSVAVESSILRGGTHCVLMVTLENEIPGSVQPAPNPGSTPFGPQGPARRPFQGAA